MHLAARVLRTPSTCPAAGPRLLFFDGVSTIADVFVNGRLAGQHRGAYTRFVVDATAHVRAGDNVLAVRVSDAPQDTTDTLPSGRSKRLYLSYGGIYRKAWLVQTASVHVDPTDHASSGVYVTPSAVSAEAARFSIRTLVRNAGSASASVQVRQRVRMPRRGGDGLEGRSTSRRARAASDLEGRIDAPAVGPAHPHLYTVSTEVRTGGAATDAVDVRTGFRDFRLEGGRFVLNGVPIALRGVGKHQETEYGQAAMSDEEIREDFANLRDLGVNCVRLAHYPHAPLAYDLADEMGLLVWAENGHSNVNRTTDTGDHITREMVRQNYNHPSIVFWSVGNETGFVRVNRFAAVARAEDPHRFITYASNTGGKGKKRYPDLDFIAHNTYRGWYRGEPWEFEQKALEMGFISENGAGAVITNHTDYADLRHEVDRFEPEEYRQVMAEVQMQVVFRDQAPRRPMYLVWILRDFAIDKYKGVRNTKGLLTYANFRRTRGTCTGLPPPAGPGRPHHEQDVFLRGAPHQRREGLLERAALGADRQRGVAGPPGQRRVPARTAAGSTTCSSGPPLAPGATRWWSATGPATGNGPSSTTTARTRPPPRTRWCATCGPATPGTARCSSISRRRRNGRSTPSSTAPPTTPSTSCPRKSRARVGSAPGG